MHDSESHSINKMYNHLERLTSKGKKLRLINYESKNNQLEVDNGSNNNYNNNNIPIEYTLAPKTSKYIYSLYNTYSLSPDRNAKLMNLSAKSNEKSPNNNVGNQIMKPSLTSSQKFSSLSLKKSPNDKLNQINGIMQNGFVTNKAHYINYPIDSNNILPISISNLNPNKDYVKPHHRKNFASAIAEKLSLQKTESHDYNSKDDSDQKNNNSLISSSQGKFKITQFKFPKDIRKQKTTTTNDEEIIGDSGNLTSPNVALKHTDLSLNDSKENTSEKKVNEFNVKNEDEEEINNVNHVNMPTNIKLPVKPFFILKNFADKLCDHERLEILKYENIYYIADLDHKIDADNELCYADDKGDYKVIRYDHIAYRYEIIDLLGRGSFGQVLKVYDHKHKEYYALKIIRNQKKFHFQAKIEIKILDYILQHNGQDYNIVELRDAFLFRNHVVLIFDLMSYNLYDFLKHNKFKGCSLNLIRRFAIQVLYALKFLRKHKIIHCDLKPENILLKQPTKSGIRLIDFGSSCFEHEKLYSYIQSRFYRSPDIILGLNYTTQIDMWSFGCLLAELYTGFPLFPGENEHDQILAMMEILGIPSQNVLDKSPRKKLFFEGDNNPKIGPNSKGKYRYPNSIDLAEVINCPDPSFLDLMRKCLEYDPDKRLTPEEALLHEWIIEGLPVSLQTKHLKVVENNENPNAIYQRQQNLITSQSHHTQSIINSLRQSQLISHQHPRNQNPITSTTTTTGTTGTHHIHPPPPPNHTENNSLGSTITTIGTTTASGANNPIQIRKSHNTTFLINSQLSGLVRDRKDFSKEKVGLKAQQPQQQQQQQQQQGSHYIPKDFIRNISNKKKSKRSINLNIKSETANEDDSVINITINLTGANNQYPNKSLETCEELNFIGKEKKQVNSVKNNNAKTNLLNNFFQIAKNNNSKKYNGIGQTTVYKDEASSSIESLVISPKTSLKNQMKISSPINNSNLKPKSLERKKQSYEYEGEKVEKSKNQLKQILNDGKDDHG